MFVFQKKTYITISRNTELVFVLLKHNTDVADQTEHTTLKTFVLLVQNVPSILPIVLTTVGDGDGELLVAIRTVGPHSTDDVDHLLLGRSRPGQGALHGLGVGGDAGQVVLGRHGGHVMVSRPDKVDDVAWSRWLKKYFNMFLVEYRNLKAWSVIIG